MKLNMLFSRDTRLGYGRMGHDLKAALQSAGVDVVDGLIMPPHADGAWLNGESTEICPQALWVCVPPHAPGWYSNQHTTICTMWEATVVPDTFVESLEAFDQLVVPSEQNLELFSKHHKNVRIGYPALNTDRWAYRPRVAPDREFRFLCGGSGRRKGADLAVEAFRKVFPNGSWGSGPTPILQLKTPVGQAHYGPRIRNITGFISEQEETDLYANAHVYVQPSRGEGFGLQPLQAIASGLPTILTDAHGHAAFADLGMPLDYTMAPAGEFAFGPAGEWWEPNLDDLCDWMLYSYEHYNTVLNTALRNSVAAGERFGFQTIGQQWASLLDVPVDFATPGVWTEPERKMYLLMVAEDTRCSIAGVDYMFRAGVKYWQSADVKRVLAQANRLDAACLSDNLSAEDATGRFLSELTDSDMHVCPSCKRAM